MKKIQKNYGEPLTYKDSRHKYFIRFNADDHSQENAGLNFYLGDVKSAKSTVSRSSEPRSGKDFIKWEKLTCTCSRNENICFLRIQKCLFSRGKYLILYYLCDLMLIKRTYF